MLSRARTEAAALLAAASATGGDPAEYACAQELIWAELCEQLSNPTP